MANRSTALATSPKDPTVLPVLYGPNLLASPISVSLDCGFQLRPLDWPVRSATVLATFVPRKGGAVKCHTAGIIDLRTPGVLRI